MPARQALDECGGVVEKAAERLKLHRDMLVNKTRKHGI